jgi:hypothetical protein
MNHGGLLIAQNNPDPVFSFTFLSPTGFLPREAYSPILADTFPEARMG